MRIEVRRHTPILGLVLLYMAAFASGFGGLDTLEVSLLSRAH